MALAMPRPTARKASGTYHLNVRIPADLAGRLKKSQVVLPLDGATVTVVATDKVAFSLRTKDPAVAKVRFASAYAALSRHFEAVRAGPKALTHKEAVALAGEAYRKRVQRFESDPTLTPDAMEAQRAQMDLDVAAWAHGPETIISADGGEAMLLPIPMDAARFFAAIQRPSGPQLLAWETRSNIDNEFVKMSLDDALDHLFGPEADAICAEKGLVIDAASRIVLLREIGDAVDDAANKLVRNMSGDYTPDPAAARFPTFVRTDEPAHARPTKLRDVETVGALYDRWKMAQAGKKAQSTIRRYGPSVASLDAFSAGRDWRTLKAADIFTWATSRTEADGVSPATVNRNDLVAIASILGWATSANGKKVPEANAAFGVRVEPSKKVVLREKMFHAAEISAILGAARSVVPDPRYPRASASRRWVPWLCAYSGARVQEVLWLKRADIRQEGGVSVMCLPKTKDGWARMVPLHQALIDEGFLAFVAASPEGWLFVGDKAAKEGATRTIQEMRATELAAWVRSKVGLSEGVSPLHGWRHTWITLAEAAGIPPRLSNRITGHNMGDVSGRYVGRAISLLAAEMAKFPRYDV